jgi:hypothetical protein
MLYKKFMGTDSRVLVAYLGLDPFEALGGPVRKRDCPNCATYDHQLGHASRFVADGKELLELTSANCQRIWWKCPGCTHGKACSEYSHGNFKKKFVTRNGVLRRFIDERDFAARMGVHPQTIKRWIAVGKLSESDGLVRGPWHNFIDTEKCPLLRKGRSKIRKAA